MTRRHLIEQPQQAQPPPQQQPPPPPQQQQPQHGSPQGLGQGQGGGRHGQAAPSLSPTGGTITSTTMKGGGLGGGKPAGGALPWSAATVTPRVAPLSGALQLSK